MVKPRPVDSGLNNAFQLTVAGNQLYFLNQGGVELWEVNGSSVVNLGNYGPIQQLTVDSGLLYFTANDTAGTGLWVANGTVVTDVAPGLSSPGQLTPAGSLLYFTAGVGGVDLWETDGTSAQQLGQFDPAATTLRLRFIRPAARHHQSHLCREQHDLLCGRGQPCRRRGAVD